MKSKHILVLSVICLFSVFISYASNNLKFDSNRVFFTTHGGLQNVIDKEKKGEDINQNKLFEYTKGWVSVTDTLVWGVDVSGKCTVDFYPVLGVPDSQAGAKVKVLFNGMSNEISLRSTGGYLNFMKQEKVSFRVSEKGRYILKLCISSLKTNGQEIAYVKGFDYFCNNGVYIEPVKLRWRPSAVHCSFSSSLAPEEIVIAIHENTIVTPWVDCYQPITSPFGYYGSTWDSKKQQFGGVNFSLWSFSNKGDIPEPHKFSHLIAVGKGLYIDGFNHEGTGVKARGKNPFEDKCGNTQVLALKKIPGNPYDVYYSYYWDTDVQEWKLYGCGKKFNDKGISYLRTGAFVEQPGRAEVERSNHIMRQVNFKGWLVDSKGKIYQIDRMSPKGKVEENSYKNWGKTSDGYFYMQMGGFSTECKQQVDDIVIKPDESLPVYLSPEKIKGLNELPANITELSALNVTDNSAIVNFSLGKITPETKVRLYWGTKDGLTFVKDNKGGAGLVYWDNNVEIPVSLSSGKIEYKLTNLTPATTYYYRLQVINEDGETWSFDTESFTTK